MAFIAWLDTSAEQQRRMREVVKLFSDTETLDELGIGQIRDSFSDMLFPGTSSIQTRARYFLFVPWAFQLAADKKFKDVRRAAENYERTMIASMMKGDDREGLIGRQAGIKVRTLPSQIYWGGLGRYEILRSGVSMQQISQTPVIIDQGEELVERRPSHWSLTIPAAPPGFPGAVEGQFALTPEEAAWLQERILTAVPESLLALLVRTPANALADGDAPWDACRPLDLPASIESTLNHAELFSMAIQGATLLYNIMVAERFDAAGFSNPVYNVDPANYRQRFDAWNDEVNALWDRITAWDMAEFWTKVRGWNPQIAIGTISFVTQWLDAMRKGAAQTAPANADLRRLIQHREVLKKGRLARLASDDQLRRWTGESATRRLYYRWNTVRVILRDIEAGLTNAGA